MSSGTVRARPTGNGARRSFRRALVTVAAGPVLAGYTAVAVVLALVAWAAAGAELAIGGTVRAAGAAWLAMHQVPLVLEGAPLGVLPLLPTVLLGGLIAWTAARAARRGGLDAPSDAVRLIGAVAAVHAVGGTGIAATISSAADPAVTAAPWRAALGCGLLAATAAACGLAGPCGWLRAVMSRAPGWTGHALVGGALGLAVLLTGGFAAVLVALLASAGAAGEAFGTWGPGWGTGLGLVLLSIAYLPNAAIAAASWLAGPGLSVGTFSTTPLGVLAGPVPEVPLLAALPEGPAASWWPVAFVVPVLAGAAVGRRCAAATADHEGRLRAVAGSAGVAALGCFVLALLAGGQLGGGVFDPVQVPAASLAVAVGLWTFLPGAVVVWFSGTGEDAAPRRSLPDGPTGPTGPIGRVRGRSRPAPVPPR